MSSLVFINTCGVTLEGGPVTVLESEQYVGECMMETIVQNEKKILPYSVDLDCKITVQNESQNEPVYRTEVNNGRIMQYYYSKDIKNYMISYTGKKKELELWIEHPKQA